MNSETNAKMISELEQALLRLSNTYWHAGDDRYGPEPDPSFSPYQVQSAWEQGYAALKLCAKERATVGMDVIHTAIRQQKDRRDDQ